MNNKIRDRVTNDILEKLEQGIKPRHPNHIASELQHSLATGKIYTGMNQLVLSYVKMDKEFVSDLRATFNATKKHGGSVKRREKAVPCIYYNVFEKEDPNHPRADSDGIVKTSVARLFHLFNLDQTTLSDNLEADIIEAIPKQKTLLDPYINQGPSLIHGGPPSYHKIKDEITMPHPQQFNNYDNYLHTKAHEVVHSSGHSTRLDRSTLVEPTHFASYQYSKEELVAQIGAMFLAKQMGLEVDDDNEIAYVKHWYEKLQKEKSRILQASSEARKASEYVVSFGKENLVETLQPSEAHE